MLRFPPPRSGPEARKSTSAIHVSWLRALSDQMEERWLPGATGVKTMRLERASGEEGVP